MAGSHAHLAAHNIPLARLMLAKECVQEQMLQIWAVDETTTRNGCGESYV